MTHTDDPFAAISIMTLTDTEGTPLFAVPGGFQRFAMLRSIAIGENLTDHETIDLAESFGLYVPNA